MSACDPTPWNLFVCDKDLAENFGISGCQFGSSIEKLMKSINLLCGAVKVGSRNRPISVYRLGEMPIQSCGQSGSAPRRKAGARLNAHTELPAKRQRSAREAIYRNRPIVSLHVIRVQRIRNPRLLS